MLCAVIMSSITAATDIEMVFMAQTSCVETSTRLCAVIIISKSACSIVLLERGPAGQARLHHLPTHVCNCPRACTTRSVAPTEAMQHDARWRTDDLEPPSWR